MKVSICIPTVGRETLPQTIKSIFNALPAEGIDVQLCIFANSISQEMHAYLKELEHEGKIEFDSSDTRLPPWHSMRGALKMASGDLIWLLGDDDRLENLAFIHLSKALGTDEASIVTPHVILVDGIYDNYEGRQSLLPKNPIKRTQVFNELSEILKTLSSDLHTLNNGRFLVNSVVNGILIQQPDTVIETYHEEYRALFHSLMKIIQQESHLLILGIQEPIVILGDVVKSWSAMHTKAVFGELVMISRLPEIFEPTRSGLFSKHLRTRTTLIYLVSLKMKTLSILTIPKEIQLDLASRVKINFVNRTPFMAVRIAIRIYRLLCVLSKGRISK